MKIWRDAEDHYVVMTGSRLRFYHTHSSQRGGGYYALRLGRRWLYRFQGKWRFSEYGNVVG